MQFRVLGPLEVSDRGQSLDPGTPRPRRLLGLLLLHAGDPVTYGRLADRLWDGERPPTARHTLQVYVHRLRLTLGDQAGRLETRRLGYQLKVADGELDTRDLALEMAAGLLRYWQLRGHLAEARTWLTRALDLEGPSPLPHVRALIGLAGIGNRQFDLDAAEATYRHAREAARHLDWWLQLDAVFGLGMTLACHRGDLAEAKEFEAELWALVSEHDDEPIATGLALAAVQAMRLLAGDLEESRRYGEMCLEGTRQVGERWYELQVLRTLALTSLRQQCYRQARDELQGCVSIAFELGDLPGIAMDFDRSGQVAVLLGEPERGCVLAGVADRLREQVGETLTPEAFRWEKDRATVTASPTLGETEIARARARGRTLTLQQAAILADELVATAVRSPGHRRS